MAGKIFLVVSNKCLWDDDTAVDLGTFLLPTQIEAEKRLISSDNCKCQCLEHK